MLTKERSDSYGHMGLIRFTQGHSVTLFLPLPGTVLHHSDPCGHWMTGLILTSLCKERIQARLLYQPADLRLITIQASESPQPSRHRRHTVAVTRLGNAQFQ